MPKIWETVIVPLLLLYSGVYLAVVLMPESWRGDRAGAFFEFAIFPVGLLASVGACRAAWRTTAGTATRRAWWLVALSFWSWLLASVTWIALGFPEVSIADIGFVGFYPLVMAGLLAFPTRGARVYRRAEFWIDVATIAIGGFMLVWHFSLSRMAGEEYADFISAIVNFAYPILSLILLLGSVSVWLRDPSIEVRRALGWLTVGALAFCGADIVYAAQTLSETYAPGGAADAGWFFATVAFALASSQRELRDLLWPGVPRPEHAMFDVRYLPYAAIGCGYAILLYATATRSARGTGIFIACGVVLTVLVLIRQIRTVREFAAMQAERVASAERVRTEARLTALVRNSSDVILVIDSQGAIDFASPPIERDFGYSPAEVLGKRLLDWVHSDDEALVTGSLRLADADPMRAVPIRYRVRRPTGEWRLVESIATDMRGDDSIRGVVLNMRDITDREELESRLTHQAFHDPLTNLPNRALFRDRLVHALERESRSPVGIAVFFLDLDGFKTVNDTLGHGVGDLLLCHVAERLLNATRGCDTVARLGGDEFAILQEGIRTEADAIPLAKRIVGSVCRPVLLQGHEVDVRLSVGISVAGAGSSAEEVLRNADLAMYRVKHSRGGRAVGRTRVTGESLGDARPKPELLPPTGEALTTIAPSAKERADPGGSREVDALVRWSSAEAPAAFVRLNESTGMVIGLDRVETE